MQPLWAIFFAFVAGQKGSLNRVTAAAGATALNFKAQSQG